jgi:aromatic-L-amino-acid decarboxylase
MARMPRLNLNDGEIARAGELLAGFLREYENCLASRPVFPPLDREVLDRLWSQPFPEDGIGVDALFHEIGAAVVPNSTTIAHPRFLAYVLPPPNGMAPFAEAIAATLNQNCNFWQLSPAASVIERKVLAWLAELFGFPESAGGILTSGGSMATLTALAVAIRDRGPRDFDRRGLQEHAPPLVVYTSAEAHRSVEKAAMILGLGLDHVRKVPVDSEFRMRPDLLAEAVRADRAAGRQPFCLVATAGTVNTGAIDPLAELGEFCRRENLWLHVDGAYGALYALSERVRPRLLPAGAADSLSLDPHKLLFAPLEAGCVLVRDREKLRRAFFMASSYLTVDEDPLLINFLDYGPQLSRNFKAFKIWCALRAFGVKAFAEAVDHTLEIARYMGERIAEAPDLELLAPVTLSAVCFRVRGADNARILARIVEEGTALLGPVQLGGLAGIRACVANYRTEREDIDIILTRVRELANEPR